MATQMQLEGNHMPPRAFRKKRQQPSRVFFKGDEFRRKKNMEIASGGEKMRNTSGQQGENERQ